ncbi:hypothetical protein J4410_07050 [Candidatus Woesearchaeota archaeon]|nr:hypothetical protein [Candidatus Woesearchaeota archaeon]
MKSFILIFLGLLIFLAACTTETIPTETTQNTTSEQSDQEAPAILQPNQILVCDGEHQVVEGFQCVCEQGYKVCNKQCVPESQCCTNSDCPSGICTNGACTNPCENTFCPINQVCDPNTGKCGCTTGNKYCNKQDRCIALSQCCDNADCNRAREGRRCVEITTSVNVCVNDGAFCKWVRLDTPANVALNQTGFTIKVEELYDSNLLDVTINDVLFERQAVPGTVIVGADEITFSEFKLSGGQCQEFS